jgi:hypothetical protein
VILTAIASKTQASFEKGRKEINRMDRIVRMKAKGKRKKRKHHGPSQPL